MTTGATDTPGPMTPEASSPTIAVDLPCIGCGYNLRSLQRDASCPDCGRAVGESLEAARLVFVSPGKLRGVARVCVLCAAGLATLPWVFPPALPTS